MAKRLFVLASAVVLVAGMSSTADAGPRGKLTINYKLLPLDQQRLLGDPPMAHLNATSVGVRADTAWFGGVDENGLAVAGGTWGFEDGTLQGWTSLDKTEQGEYFRLISRAGTGGPNEVPAGNQDPVIGGNRSLWVGAWESEAGAGCWPGGQGYDNGWGLDARRLFEYTGSGTVTLGFDYFTDSETQFDYAYVYTVVDGTLSSPLNSSAWSTPEGWGYSGAQDEGTAIGTPTSPANDSIIIAVTDLPVGAGAFEILFNFQSDPLYSDGLDSFGGFLNSRFGPWGLDDISVAGVGLSASFDFEAATYTGDRQLSNGWTFTDEGAIGQLIAVNQLSSLDPIGDPCTCPITLSGGEYVMTAADILGEFKHPKRQRELLQSPPAYTGGGAYDAFTLSQWSVWEDTPTSNGVGYRPAMHYYPWTCPTTETVGWTLEPAGDGGFIFSGLGGARCVTFRLNNDAYMPDIGVDSVKIVFELLGDCDDFGTVDCDGPEGTNQSPYWDNLRLGFTEAGVAAPALSADLIYQDCYPRENSLLPSATADAYVYYDNNRADQDPTNANMGDSAVVISGTEPGSEIYLNFRIYPGPAMDLSDAEFDRYGADASLAPSWAKARMDTAEALSGLQPGLYSTYDWPNGQETGSSAKIIPDGFLMPGSLVEYFFSSNFTSTPGEQRFSPDTTGGFFFEYEVLPGYTSVDGALAASCVLYVDAWNAGAQVPVEDRGLRPYLGTTNGHDDWDRYDYFAASSNVPAPLARESASPPEGIPNGMTKYQSLIYRTILYNTGSNSQEGLRNGDADLLQTWLTTDDFGRNDIEKGLWLSGDGMASILNRPDRTDNNNLLANFVSASLASDEAYRDQTGDSSVCVKLAPSPGRDFPAAGDSYSAARGNGCPNLNSFNIVTPIGDAAGNMEYVDQDAGGAITQYASVSNVQSTGAGNYYVVLDAFSLHYMRATPDTWTGDDCGQDSTAITRRVSDVFTWMGTETGLCDTTGLVIAVQDGLPTVPGIRTVLFNNTPNPFNPRTTVRYQLADDAHVKLSVYDVKGRLVRTLVDGVQEANRYDIVWDGVSDAGEAVSSGVYWARMSTSTGYTGSTKMVILK